MTKITNSQVTDDSVIYTFDRQDDKGNNLTYVIPRTFTAEEADLTLAAYLRGLDSDEPVEDRSTSIDDWDEDLSTEAIIDRSRKIEEDRKQAHDEYLERMKEVTEPAKIEVSSEATPEMLHLAKSLEPLAQETEQQKTSE